MCKAHWFALDSMTRAAIWREYREGQEIDKDPSLRYIAVAQHAIGALVFQPFDAAAALAATPYFVRSLLHRRAALANGDGDPLPWVPLPADPPPGEPV